MRFSLRALFAAATVFAVCLFNWQSLLNLTFGYFYAIAFLLVISGWFGTQYLRSGEFAVRPRVRAIGWFGSFILLAGLLFVFWVRYRWFMMAYDDIWPRTFPYPDTILLAFHDWIDAQFPPEAGAFKIHGEFYTVLMCLNLFALANCIVVGVSLGLICRKDNWLGVDFWKQQIVMAFAWVFENVLKRK